MCHSSQPGGSCFLLSAAFWGYLFQILFQVEEYTRGLCWVFLYYFSGVPSWTWFYPFHYGPFASDLKGLSSTKVIFHKGVPFKPFDQLMAVLPPTSAHALPISYQSLMTDEESSILDFYPSDFESDTDGKTFLWQSICKLPFINEERFLAATKKIEKELGEEEAKRNVRNRDQLYVHVSEDFASRIMLAFNDLGSNKQYNSIKIDKCISGDMCGFVLLHDIHGYQGRNNWMGAKQNPGVGFRNECPDITTKGAGNGWNPRGRGKHHDVTRTPNKQMIGGSWLDTNVAGTKRSPGVCCRNPFPDIVIKGAGIGWNPRGRGRSQDVTRAPYEQTIVQSWGDSNRRGTQGNIKTNHVGRTSRANGQFWEVWTDSSGRSNQVLNQRIQSRNDSDR